LKLKEDEGITLSRIYYHFVPSIDDISLYSEKIKSFSAWNHDIIHVVTLREMLQPFRDAFQNHSNTNISQPRLDPVDDLHLQIDVNDDLHLQIDVNDDRHLVDDSALRFPSSTGHCYVMVIISVACFLCSYTYR
jgi:hypothetical protein